MTNFIYRQDLGNFRNLQILNQYLENHNGFIAGGCFKNIFNHERVKDIDIFFRSEKDYERARTNYETLVNCGIYREDYKNDKVVSFKNIHSGIRIELVKSIFGNPSELLDEFDFTITKFAYWLDNSDPHVMHHPLFFEHLFLKKLVIDNEKLSHPISTFERVLKYTRYGYALCKESKIRLIDNIRKSSDISDDQISESLYNGVD